MSTAPRAPASPSPQVGWVSMRHVQRMASSGLLTGLGLEGLLAQAGVGPEQLSHVDGMVPLAAVEIMLAALERHVGDPLLGLHGANDIQPNTLGALGHLLQACATFGDVLDVVVRYRGMLSNIGHVSVAHAPGLVQLHWACLAGSPLFRRHASEYVIGTAAVITRLLAPGAACLPTAVHFSHGRPESHERVRDYFDFFRCPVQFDQPSTSIIFPATLLQARLPYGDAVLKDLLEQHARNLLLQREQGASIQDDVCRLIKAMVLQGAASKEAVAEQLGISPRSLHRRLQEVGTSYQSLVDATRLAQACELLNADDAPVGGIADRLGFSSRQAFMRWFRHQRGITPSQYRHRPRPSDEPG